MNKQAGATRESNSKSDWPSWIWWVIVLGTVVTILWWWLNKLHHANCILHMASYTMHLTHCISHIASSRLYLTNFLLHIVSYTESSVSSMTPAEEGQPPSNDLVTFQLWLCMYKDLFALKMTKLNEVSRLQPCHAYFTIPCIDANYMNVKAATAHVSD